MSELPELLRDNVRSLGEILGNTILEDCGTEIFRQVEEIRRLGKAINQGEDVSALIAMLSELEDQSILPIARAFNQFLNLANIAEQQYFSSHVIDNQHQLENTLSELAGNHGKDAVAKAIANLRIELVLTAHPTEVTRRTLIHKYEQISYALTQLSRTDLLNEEREQVQQQLKRTVAEIWHTDEIRTERPTAVDEAKWGFAVIENSLWHAVPQFLRALDSYSKRKTGKGLAVDSSPFRFLSWMGGDRDGNPNVTHEVTAEVVLLGRWMAADLYLRDVSELINLLSMHEASDHFNQIWRSERKAPYRECLHQLRQKLKLTRQYCQERLDGRLVEHKSVIQSRQDILEPLLACYDSLTSVGLKTIADGELLNSIRRVYCFGISLAPLDVRQDAGVHQIALNEITEYLGLGSYRDWSEEKKVKFLVDQLSNKRPLIPRHWNPSEITAEVLATCEVIAQEPAECLSSYIISMAEHSSDVLAVALLLRETSASNRLPIVPLFETLDDLERSVSVMADLWQLEWYRNYCQGSQCVMIGYSDSAKDAGKLTATWAQYRAQERLVALAEQFDIKLILFHGRGGTIGRGGGPVEKAMASQPPGSVPGKIRVTEQGEMIRHKFGLPRVALRNLSLYVAATLRATLQPNPAPKQEWRDLMEAMSKCSLRHYREVVRGNPEFVSYFRALTPEQELGKLALGSRPARRKAGGGIETLRAIPWVFAWMQVRLNLPAWLGAPQALQYAVENHPDVLKEMISGWPFFEAYLDLLEMVLVKTNLAVASYYESQLVAPEQSAIGKTLRDDLKTCISVLNSLKGQSQLLSQDPVLKQSISVRNPYTDPLNYLQAELLKRDRHSSPIEESLELALKVTMAGIAAGMRNTG